MNAIDKARGIQNSALLDSFDILAPALRLLPVTRFVNISRQLASGAEGMDGPAYATMFLMGITFAMGCST
jgi:hypothetical protein